MNERAEFYQNYTRDYQLNFRELVWWKRVQQFVCHGFQIEIFSNFY